MEDTSKYLIHARITADGVVERSDVVGAVFGQTEGLLGDELDLRDLQQSSKIGRIDVEIDSEHGQSFGTITITSSLDKVETAILAASLEAITRVGPCEARVEVAEIEDMRAAKRREVVERAKQLLTESFDDSVMDSTEILEEVRDAQRVERIDDYAGYPAGPRVDDSDAIIVVEGRSDVLTLLEYGIKNAIAVEGTNVPTEVADLTQDRTVTAFLDGDRGGDLILRELAQVADVDYVAFAPEGKSVEDLARGEVMNALREKAPFDTLDPGSEPNSEPAATDGSARPAPAESDDGPHPTPDSPTTPSFDAEPPDSTVDDTEGEGGVTDDGAAVDEDGVVAGDDDGRTATGSVRTNSDHTTDPVGGVGDRSSAVESETETTEAETTEESVTEEPADESADDELDDATEPSADADAEPAVDAEDESITDTKSDEDTEADEDTESDTESEPDTETDESATEPTTLRGHIRDVIDGGSRRARLLDDSYAVLEDVPTGEAFDTLADGETTGFALVIDGQLDQRLLDVAAQRGVEQIVATTEGEFVKRPASVRVVTADRFASA